MISRPPVASLWACGGLDAIDYARTWDASSNLAHSLQQDMRFTKSDAAMVTFILITDVGYHIP